MTNMDATDLAIQVGSVTPNTACKPIAIAKLAMPVLIHPANVRSLAKTVRSSAQSVRSCARSFLLCEELLICGYLFVRERVADHV